MRNIMVLLASILVTGSLVWGITWEVMDNRADERVARMEVDAFNDGFLYGACSQRTYEDGSSVWEDGNGNLCQMGK
ncbi:hypothetical protein [Streptomyces sp. NPDC057363]|uniref:hypothetical protein n=1 Tax=Streptomyces sp. NPDC057363 TaxID=3346107 RepID=UPI00362FC463